MKAIVLGAAAGGGFPQWNSNSDACRRARAGDPSARPATQASLAVSADGARWHIVNASPDLRAQIEATPALHPRDGLRGSPIDGVILTNGDVDAVAGLLTLREKTGFHIHAHRRVLDHLDRNPIFDVVDRALAPRSALPLDAQIDLPAADGSPSGLAVRAFMVPGKTPLYAEDPEAENFGSAEGDVIGLAFATARSTSPLIFIANCAAPTESVRAQAAGAAALFFDGTLYADDEMRTRGEGVKTGRRMGHVSMSGEDGAIAAFADVALGRRVFMHINNTNPTLLTDSAERKAVEAAGWEIAYDGMELSL